MPSIKGTASVADDRAISKLLRSTRFPPNFSKKVDQTRVHREVLSQWIEDRIQELLGFEDDIVASTAVNLFLPPVPEDGARPAVDPRRAQLDLVGFLGEGDAAAFASELWTLLIDAQTGTGGIPRRLLEAKKAEMAKDVFEKEGEVRQLKDACHRLEQEDSQLSAEDEEADKVAQERIRIETHVTGAKQRVMVVNMQENEAAEAEQSVADVATAVVNI